MLKDTVITASRKKRELLILLYCFIGANIFNLVGIIIYSTPATELFTQLHIVLLVSLGFYIVVVFFRILYWSVAKLIKKSKASTTEPESVK